MNNLEEEIFKTVSNLSTNEQMSVAMAAAKMVMETQAKMQDYVESDKYQKKYANVEENIDSQLICIKETVDYGLDKFVKAYDKSKEMKLLGEKTEELKTYMINSVKMVLQVGLAQEYLPKYLEEKIEELPKKISNTKKMEKIQGYVSEFAVKIGAGKELEQFFQAVATFPLSEFY